LAHYDGTAEERIEQCSGRVDVVVLTAGTGGTITGIARKLKEKIPNVKIVGVDPDGSILALPETLNGAIHSYKVEGIGYDFIPTVFDRDLQIVDKWYKSFDTESFVMSRRLIKEEGLLCGGSAGSAMHAAIQAIKDYKLGPEHRVVVLLADSVRNYMSKFLNDDWMKNNGFTPVAEVNQEAETFKGAAVKDLSLPDAITVSDSVTISSALETLSKGGFDQIPVEDASGNLVGLITVGSLLAKTSKGKVKGSDPVSSGMYVFNKKRAFVEFTMETKLADLKKFFEKNHSALIVAKENGKLVVKKVVTKVDLLRYLMKQ